MLEIRCFINWSRFYIFLKTTSNRVTTSIDCSYLLIIRFLVLSFAIIALCDLTTYYNLIASCMHITFKIDNLFTRNSYFISCMLTTDKCVELFFCQNSWRCHTAFLIYSYTNLSSVWGFCWTIKAMSKQNRSVLKLNFKKLKNA